MFASLLLIVFICISIFVSPWAWLGVALVAVWKWRMWYRYNGRPWRKIHFNAMIFAAAAMAKEQAASDKLGEAFNINNAYIEIIYLFKKIGVFVSEDPAQLVQMQLLQLSDGYDKQLVVRYMVEKKGINFEDASNRVEAIYSNIDPQDNYFKLRAVIAGIIEDQYGLSDRGEYWYNVLSNNAP